MSPLPRPSAAGTERARLRAGSRPPAGRARLRPASRGQALVELAIIVPVLLIVVGAAIDLGRLFNAFVSIENAAKEGAFFGSTLPRCDTVKAGCVEPHTVDWHVRNELPGITIGTPVIECLDAVAATPKSVEACAENDVYRVTVSHDFRLVTPLLAPILGSRLELISAATALVFNQSVDPNATPFPMPTGTDEEDEGEPPEEPPIEGCSPPAANFSFTVQNKRVTFTDASTAIPGCGITSWSWTFGDGGSTTGVGPVSHQYPSKDTTYQATLTVTNAAGQNSLTKAVTTQ